jgi:20S proteasome alpha/beta subunit
MLVPGSNRRVSAIHLGASVVFSGVVPDGRAIVAHARQEVVSYQSTYGKLIPSKVLASRVAAFVHAHTLYWFARPFGAAIILAAVDESGVPELYMIEPSG